MGSFYKNKIPYTVAEEENPFFDAQIFSMHKLLNSNDRGGVSYFPHKTAYLYIILGDLIFDENIAHRLLRSDHQEQDPEIFYSVVLNRIRELSEDPNHLTDIWTSERIEQLKNKLVGELETL